MSHLTIKLDSISRHYRFRWIIDAMSATFETGRIYAIAGPNGSGKSTLMRLLATLEAPDKGRRYYTIDDLALSEDEVCRHLSFVSPAMRLPEHLTVLEVYDLHSTFKTMQYDRVDWIAACQLEAQADQRLNTLSTGQLQKVKLGLTLLNDDALLLLDEPGSNLDATNFSWMADHLRRQRPHRLIVIASNDPKELELADVTYSVTEENSR